MCDAGISVQGRLLGSGAEKMQIPSPHDLQHTHFTFCRLHRELCSFGEPMAGSLGKKVHTEEGHMYDAGISMQGRLLGS
jgi:hypothetical protein